MKVTLAINNYNYARYLPEAIASAVAQDYPGCEVMVVDDGSTDDSLEQARAYSEEIKLVALPHRGQISAVNEALRQATGDLIFLLDADDLFDVDKVRKVVEAIHRQEIQDEAFILYHPMRIIDAERQVRPGQMPVRVKRIERLFSETGKWCRICTLPEVKKYIGRHGFPPFLGSGPSCLVLSRAMLDKIYPLPDDRRAYADSLIVRRGLAVGPMYCLNQVLGSYRVHGNNIWFGRSHKKDLRRYFVFLRSQVAIIEGLYQQQGIFEPFDLYASMEAWYYFKRMGSPRGLTGVSLRMLQRSWYWKNVVFALRGFSLAAWWRLQRKIRFLQPV